MLHMDCRKGFLKWCGPRCQVRSAIALNGSQQHPPWAAQLREGTVPGVGVDGSPPSDCATLRMAGVGLHETARKAFAGVEAKAADEAPHNLQQDRVYFNLLVRMRHTIQQWQEQVRVYLPRGVRVELVIPNWLGVAATEDGEGGAAVEDDPAADAEVDLNEQLW